MRRKRGKEGGRTKKDGREERKEPRRKEVGWRTQEGSGEGGSAPTRSAPPCRKCARFFGPGASTLDGSMA